MNGKERTQIDKLADRVAGVELSQKEVSKSMKTILTNHLPHIMTELGQLWTMAESARFRSGIVIVGLALIGIMIAVLGIVVAAVVA